MFQFASPDRQWGWFFNGGGLGLHTSAYYDNEDFVAKFQEGLDALLNVPGLNIRWMEAVGFRYVNLVEPLPGESLDDYLRNWVLPQKPDIGEEMDLLQGMYVAAYKTAYGELRFQSLRNPTIRPSHGLEQPSYSEKRLDAPQA